GQRGLLGFPKQAEIDAEVSVRRFAACHRLKDEIDRRASLYCCERRGHMSKHTRLPWEAEPLSQSIKKARQLDIFVETVGRRVDPDDGVARCKHQTVQDGCRYAMQIVGRMIRLQPRRQGSREPDRVPKAVHDSAL